MKKSFPLILFLLSFISFLPAQVLLHTEDFETSGEGSRYSGTFTDGTDVMAQTTSNPAPSFANSVTGISNSGYIYSEDMDGASGINPNHPTGILSLNAVTITGYDNLEIRILLGDARADGRFESADKIEVVANIDGGGDVVVGRFMYDATLVGSFGNNMSEDEDLDGTADGNNVLGTAAVSYTFDVAGTGTSLVAKVIVTTDGGTEELFFDNIQIYGAVALPVEWKSVEAVPHHSGMLIQWETSLSLNSDYFSIERSQDGQNFTKIARKQSLGNTDQISQYSFIDEHIPSSGRYHYRIVHYDLDGQKSYSKVVHSSFALESIVRLYPNPVLGAFTLEGDVGQQSQLAISILDNSGRKVYIYKIFETFNGSLKLDWPPHLGHGMYILQLKDATQSHHIPIIH